MLNFFIFILGLAIVSGQLLKIPLSYFNGITFLDFVVIALDLLLLINLKFKLKQFPKIIKSSMPFTFLGLISLAFTPIKLNTSEYFISFLYLFRFSCFCLLAGLISLDHFKKLKPKLPSMFAISGILLSALGILQLIFFPSLKFLDTFGWDPHFYRVVSTWLDPNFIGASFVLTLILINQDQVLTIPRKMKLVLFGLVFFTLLATFSRSASIMFFVSFITLSFFNKSWKLLFATLVLSLILFFGVKFYNQVIAAPNNIDRNQSANNRIHTWEIGKNMFLQNPLLGVGFNSYRFALKQYSLAPEQYIESRGATSNDSSFLFVLATTGIIGFLAYLFFWFSILKENFKKNDHQKIILLSGAAGLIAEAFFNNSLFYPPLFLWILLMSI